MKKSTKTTLLIIAAVLALAIVAGGMIWVYHSSRSQGGAGNAEGSGISISVTVVHKDGSEETFEYTTACRTLGEVLYGQGLIRAEGVDDGMFNIVDGEKADRNTDQSYWALYEGEEYAMEGVDALLIEDGDHFRLVYTVGF